MTKVGEVKGNGVPLDGMKTWKDLLSYHYRGIAGRIFKLRSKSMEIPYYVKALSFYYYLTPKKYNTMLISWWKEFGLIPKDPDQTESWIESTSQGHIVERAKILTEFVLKWRSMIGDGYERLLSMNDGLLPWVDVRDDDVKDLYTSLNVDYGSEVITNNSLDYINSFKAYSKRWMSAGVRSDFKKPLSFREFVENPTLWATPGATIEPGIRYYDGEKWHTSKKTKWSLALRLDTDQLIQLALQSTQTYASLSIKKKEGPPKLRPVSKETIGDYLCESYWAYYCEPRRKMGSYGTSYESPLSNTLEQNVERQQYWIRLLNVNTPAVDLDARNFDLNYSFDENQAWFEAGKELAKEENWPYHQDIEKCINALLSRSRSIKLKYSHTGQKIEYNRGLLTGKRTTSLQGTCKSSVVVNMVIDKLGIRDKLVHASTNGDDTNVFFEDIESVNKFFNGVLELNAIVVHPLKTLSSPGLTNEKGVYNSIEYLKVLYSSKPWKVGNSDVFARGVPVRAIKSVLLRSPESDENVRSPVAMVNNWIRCMNRGLDVEQCKKFMTQDLSRYFAREGGKFEDARELTVRWFGTPLSIGGAGLEDLFGATEYGNWVIIKNVENEDTRRFELQKIRTKVLPQRNWLKWGIEGTDIVEELPNLFGIAKPRSEVLTAIHNVQIDGFRGAYPLSYLIAPNDKIGGLMSFLVSKWMRTYRNDWRSQVYRLSSYVDQKSFELLMKLRNKWTRAAFFDLLAGRLWNTQIVLGYSGLQLSEYSEIWKEKAFGRLVNFKTSKSTIVRARQWVNTQTKLITQSVVLPLPF